MLFSIWLSFSKISIAQNDYQFDLGIDLQEYEMHWDTAVIHAMNISEIQKQEYSITYAYTFGENGKLKHYAQIEDSYYGAQTTIVDYYTSGKIQSYKMYYSSCDYIYNSTRDKNDEHSAPFCFDLLDDLSILDTNRADRLKVSYAWKNIYGDFWRQEITLNTYKIVVLFQMDNHGKIFYMEWSTIDSEMWTEANRSILKRQLDFDTSGVISELITYEDVGSELRSYADTTLYMNFVNVSGYPRCTKMIIWDGGGYDPVYRVYEGFDTDTEPGIDTAYFLLEHSKYEGWNSSFYYHHIPFAESFTYLSSGKIEKKTYITPYWKFIFNDVGEVVAHEIIDSISLGSISRFLPNNYFEAQVLEHFTSEYNTLQSCRSCRFPNFTDIFLCSFMHNKNELYLDENWINDPNVKCDSSYVVQPIPIMTKREYKKWLQAEIESVNEILSDTSMYRVKYN
ncbi:MAG: hypothetical protein IPG07_12010 [Crocinitomicaceae bacterium]|nr:hypothetical protein [Crocinitomicaceae bacterium]MBK6951562.1 hypothetical protein [Crocinitomicaceae bacterium]